MPKEKGIRGKTYIKETVYIEADNETKKINIAHITGNICVKYLCMEIKNVSKINNLTNLYLDIFDGINSINLTAPGVDISGAGVGTFLSKDKDSSELLTLNKSDSCGLCESSTDRINDFIITSKEGTETFIRFCFETNDIVNIEILIKIEYEPISDGELDVIIIEEPE